MRFLHVRFCSVSVRETELSLTCSVWFGQNGKTLLRLVTTRHTAFPQCSCTLVWMPSLKFKCWTDCILHTYVLQYYVHMYIVSKELCPMHGSAYHAHLIYVTWLVCSKNGEMSLIITGFRLPTSFLLYCLHHSLDWSKLLNTLLTLFKHLIVWLTKIYWS